MAQPEARNFRLLAHDTLGNAGNVGEGVSLQVRPDGRRILWMAHECAPKNFTGVDVTDPTKPRMILQTELPHRNVRSNSLEVCGDIMAVAYQTGTHGASPAGIELFDISAPEQPRSISFIDRSGPAHHGHELYPLRHRLVVFALGARIADHAGQSRAHQPGAVHDLLRDDADLQSGLGERPEAA